MYHYRGVGLDDVFLCNGYTMHRLPSGEEAVSIHNLEGLHKAIASELANQVGGLDGQSFRFLRKYANMGQRTLATILQVTDNTVSNWERGETAVPGAAAELLKALLRELISGNAELAATVERYNHLDQARIRDMTKLEFAECDGDWQLQQAA